MAAERLGLEPVIDPTARVTGCRLGRYTEVGARTKLAETELADYSYIVEDGRRDLHARIGKFCSIAAKVRINPGNHPFERASQAHFTYRARSYWPEEANEAAVFERRRARPRCGSDTMSRSGTAPSSCRGGRSAPAPSSERAPS